MLFNSKNCAQAKNDCSSPPKTNNLRHLQIQSLKKIHISHLFLKFLTNFFGFIQSICIKQNPSREACRREDEKTESNKHAKAKARHIHHRKRSRWRSIYSSLPIASSAIFDSTSITAHIVAVASIKANGIAYWNVIDEMGIWNVAATLALQLVCTWVGWPLLNCENTHRRWQFSFSNTKLYKRWVLYNAHYLIANKSSFRRVI